MGEGCVFCAGTGKVPPRISSDWDESEVYRKGVERLGSELFVTSLHNRRRMGNRLDSET